MDFVMYRDILQSPESMDWREKFQRNTKSFKITVKENKTLKQNGIF